jgi:hypothetical protein
MKITRTEAILARARLLVEGLSEDDSLAKAALAVHFSQCGVTRRIAAITAQLKGLSPPPVSPININYIRAVIMSKTGLNIELDDPLLLMFVVMQDIDLDGLERAATELKRRKNFLNEIFCIIHEKWIQTMFCVTFIVAAFISGLVVAYR